MKKFLFLALVLISASMVKAEQVVLQTKNTTLVLNVEGNKQPQYVYYGTKLSAFDLANLQLPRNGRMDAYPAYGMNCPAEAAIAMTHADGNMSTELYADYVDEAEAETEEKAPKRQARRTRKAAEEAPAEAPVAEEAAPAEETAE